jgi:tetratricopeptide (TPR) repeat protein
MNAPSPAVEAQSEPPRPGPVAQTIQTLLRERRHDELVALAERTVAAAPGNAEAWNLLAVALRRMRRNNAAIACLRRALDLDPGNPTAMLNLGGACGDTERPAEAAIWYRKVLERQPSAIVWTHLGVALHETGDPAAALEWAKGLTDPEARKAAMTSAIGSWAHSSPAEAATFAAQIPAGPEQVRAVTAVLNDFVLNELSSMSSSSMSWPR